MWYLTLRRAARPREEWKVSLDEHLAWMKRQHEEGNILFSGPSADRKLGIYVIRARSREEAERIARSDPYTVAGYTECEIIEWQINQIMGVGLFTAAEQQARR